MSQLLAIDPEFEARCPPLTDEEYQQLEENILEEGLVLMPIIIWNNTIVDGHNRYKIAMAKVLSLSSSDGSAFSLPISLCKHTACITAV